MPTRTGLFTPTRLLIVVSLGANACYDGQGPGTSQTEASSTSGSATGAATPTTGAEPVSPTTSTGADGPDTSTAPGASTEVSTTDAPDESRDESTGSAGPICGDGVVDGDEECDDGEGFNTEKSGCLHTCKFATCGDGYVQTGVEECDDGAGNTSEDYDGCKKGTCKTNPYCGDGDLTPGEELCDPSRPGADPMPVDCEASCRFAGRMVFISSMTYSGALEGVGGADLKCRALAATLDKERAHRYRAWITGENGSVLDRFAMSPELEGLPLVMPNGGLVAEDLEDLLIHGLELGIYIDETKAPHYDAQVWTNTQGDGAAASAEQHCKLWNSGSVSDLGTDGRNWVDPADGPAWDEWKANFRWTKFLSVPCAQKLRLYCFET